jgi:hypothetical protein
MAARWATASALASRSAEYASAVERVYRHAQIKLTGDATEAGRAEVPAFFRELSAFATSTVAEIKSLCIPETVVDELSAFGAMSAKTMGAHTWDSLEVLRRRFFGAHAVYGQLRALGWLPGERELATAGQVRVATPLGPVVAEPTPDYFAYGRPGKVPMARSGGALVLREDGVVTVGGALPGRLVLPHALRRGAEPGMYDVASAVKAHARGLAERTAEANEPEHRPPFVTAEHAAPPARKALTR